MNQYDNLPIGETLERPWGRWAVLEYGDTYRVKRFELDYGKRFSLQHHNSRTELWMIVEGSFNITLDDKQFEAVPGDIVTVGVKVKHRAEGTSKGKNVIIEIWRGDVLSEDDIVRYEDDYGRA